MAIAAVVSSGPMGLPAIAVNSSRTMVMMGRTVEPQGARACVNATMASTSAFRKSAACGPTDWM